MKIRYFILALSIALSLVPEVLADDDLLRIRALRAARKVARMTTPPEVSAKGNTNFGGIWGGRYVFAPGASNCGSRLSSFQFRHLFGTRGSSGYMNTNHDGEFFGRSRDKGRRWEFGKSVSSGGRRAVVAVVYHSLARNGNSAGTAYVLSISGGCTVTYVANAVRLAR